MSRDAEGYVAVVRQLPRPTLAQTERFARFVSGAHSWYKHLPVHPKVPFVFYLDPGAGMSRVLTGTDETALVEITDESSRFHYTWQKTADYRRRFGHWAYHAPYGSSFLFAGEGGVVSTAGAGLKVLTETGEWVSVPPDLARQGTARVSALVHLCPNFRIWADDLEHFGLAAVPEPDDDVVPPTAHLLLRRLWSFLKGEARASSGHAEAVRGLPPEALEIIRQRVAERPDSAWIWPRARDWDWPGESWLERLGEAGVEAGRISAVVKYVQVERLRALTASDQEKGEESTEWPREALCRVTEAMLEERGRQLAAMTEAMGRFVGAIFSGASQA